MYGVFLDRDSVDIGDLNLDGLRATSHHWEFHGETTPHQVASRIATAEIVVSNKVMIDARAIAQASRLKLIGVAATGTNNVDLDAARARGITVTNVRGYATPSVTPHVFALILALVRRLPDYQSAIAAGRWQASRQFCLLDFPMIELQGKTLGIIGYGELGRAVAHVAEAFGMRVLVSQRPGADLEPGRVTLRALLPQVDVLTLHCPLTPDTRNLIGARELAEMKATAILINTARGGIVHEGALAAALREGRLGGAGIDVLSEEPPRHGNPLLAPGIPNLIVTPHVAWASREARQRMIDELSHNIRAFQQGRPRNLVT